MTIICQNHPQSSPNIERIPNPSKSRTKTHHCIYSSRKGGEIRQICFGSDRSEVRKQSFDPHLALNDVKIGAKELRQE
jgi:hypothetical protein